MYRGTSYEGSSRYRPFPQHSYDDDSLFEMRRLSDESMNDENSRQEDTTRSDSLIMTIIRKLLHLKH